MENTNPVNVGNNQDSSAQPNLTSNLQAQSDALKAQAQTQVAQAGAVAQAQVDKLAQGAGAQLQNLGQGAQDQLNNLGNAGLQGMQNLGTAGVQQVGNLMGQFTQPMVNKAPQPPVLKEEKIYAGISYIPFVSIASIILKPDSAYVRLHAKQGLLLTVIFMFVGILAAIVSIFGIIGAMLGFLLGLVPLACVIIGIYSMYLAFTGYWWKIPFLSAMADLIPVEMMAKVSKENITGQVSVAKADYDNRAETIASEVAQTAVTNETIPQSQPVSPADLTGTQQVSTAANVPNQSNVTQQPTAVQGQPVSGEQVK